jgi:hypothetical protein
MTPAVWPWGSGFRCPLSGPPVFVEPKRSARRGESGWSPADHDDGNAPRSVSNVGWLNHACRTANAPQGASEGPYATFFSHRLHRQRSCGVRRVFSSRGRCSAPDFLAWLGGHFGEATRLPATRLAHVRQDRTGAADVRPQPLTHDFSHCALSRKPSRSNASSGAAFSGFAIA